MLSKSSAFFKLDLLGLLFCSSLLITNSYCQSKPDTISTIKKPHYGVGLGMAFTKFVPGWVSNASEYELTFDNNYKAGFTSNAFYEIGLWQNISLKFDLDVFHTRQHLRYNYWYYRNFTNWDIIEEYFDYELSGTILQLSVMPKVYFGKKQRLFINFGFYWGGWIQKSSNGREDVIKIIPQGSSDLVSNTTICNPFPTTRICYGFQAGFGYNFNYNKHLMSIETKIGFPNSDQIAAPNMMLNYWMLLLSYKI